MRGHLPIWPSRDARELIRKRLWRPSLLRAHNVMCVYEPRAETSSPAWLASPQRTRVESNRDVPGVTYASTPMMGFTPAAVACFQKSYAPKRYPWSVVAMAF